MPLIQFLRRKWVQRKPFPDQWQEILERDVPVWSRLPARYHEPFRIRVKVFMDEKLFEGCNGLQLTETHKVVISAYACLPILEEPSDYYRDLQVILLYPDDYMATVHEEDEAGVITSGTEARKGESWDTGSIILSWSDIEENLYRSPDGQNLILHEFAHQLDQHYGLTAGISEEGRVIHDDEWNRALASAFSEFRRKLRRRAKTCLDPYGAEHPAEFFSVATEAFFEIPAKLKSEYPALYDALAEFYRLDPAEWHAGHGRRP